MDFKSPRLWLSGVTGSFLSKFLPDRSRFLASRLLGPGVTSKHLWKKDRPKKRRFDQMAKYEGWPWPSLRSKVGQEPAMHRVSSDAGSPHQRGPKPERSDANTGIITAMTGWYTMQRSKCTPVTFPHSSLLCIVHWSCPVVSTPYKTLHSLYELCTFVQYQAWMCTAALFSVYCSVECSGV